MSFSRPALFIAAISWSPIPGPSCSRTTTVLPPTTITTVRYLWQKAPEKSADSRRMANLQRSRRLEPEEGDPIWRTAESHTRLVLVHGAGR